MRLTVLALLGAAVLGSVNLVNFAGAGYAKFAGQHLDRPDSSATSSAARIASRWPPWSSPRVALNAWVLTERREADTAIAAYHRALRLAPADPLVWSEYALALARLGRFEAPLTHALIQAQRLAPTSSAVRRTIADMGLSYWQRGTPEQRALWVSDMRRELSQDRRSFLTHVVTRGQGQTFCQDPAHLLNEAAWCASIAEALLGGPP